MDCMVLKVKNKLLLARFGYLAYSSVSFCMFIFFWGGGVGKERTAVLG